ncbi:hypothetical protein PILCRDRAFT_2546 [Piloderma croceum F 1598]|uniref:Uncharacterized protein n=1 Tax=Piloderma croceum (strain F 1598) TaxID=765440 RepID=A0A0C3BS06_PILCF|nr:hypothetical protein PILCRDRAFT_2546 [Piloderma croceum F 1598]
MQAREMEDKRLCPGNEDESSTRISMLPLAQVRRPFTLGHCIFQHKALLGCSLTLWILVEGLRNEHLKDPWTSLESPGRSTLLFAAKLSFSLVIYLWKRRVGANANNRILKGSDNEELFVLDGQGTPSGQNSLDMTSQQSHRLPLHVWTGRSMLFLSVVAAFYVLRDHAFSTVGRLADPFVPYFVIPISTLLSIIILALFFSRTFSTLLWHAILLQGCGFFIFRSSFINQNLSGSLSSKIIAAALSSSIALVSNDIDMTQRRSRPSTSRFSHLELSSADL